jgi:pyridoxal phosphate-dependent aminotransferase EpsN
MTNVIWDKGFESSYRQRLYLSPPHMSGKELEFVNEAFASNWVAPIGPMVDAFEKELCGYTGAAYAAALSSGTAALHLSLLLLGVGPGDEVVCSSFTFAGSAFPITYMNAVPVFVDSELRSWNMDPELLEKAITDRTAKGKKPKAVIVVHLYGQSADMDAIMAICARHEIPLIEDAAESLGAHYKNRHTGTFTRFGILSFNGNKIITTSGGGMLLGQNRDDIEKARFYATQARDPAPHYEHTKIGYNYRMSNIVAAIGRGQLTAVEERVAGKRALFEVYKAGLGSIEGLAFMPDPGWGRSNRWLTCITIDEKLKSGKVEEIRKALEAGNIECRPLWKPMHLQPVFSKSPAYTNGISEGLFNRGLCLPSGTAMSEDDRARVIAVVKKAML